MSAVCVGVEASALAGGGLFRDIHLDFTPVARGVSNLRMAVFPSREYHFASERRCLLYDLSLVRPCLLSLTHFSRNLAVRRRRRGTSRRAWGAPGALHAAAVGLVFPGICHLGEWRARRYAAGAACTLGSYWVAVCDVRRPPRLQSSLQFVLRSPELMVERRIFAHKQVAAFTALVFTGCACCCCLVSVVKEQQLLHSARHRQDLSSFLPSRWLRWFFLVAFLPFRC